LVWAETIFLDVRVTVSVVLGEVTATYYAAMFSANAAANKVDTVSANEMSTSPLTRRL